MSIYIKKSIEVEATQWFKNGDHPKDNADRKTEGFVAQGEVVRYYRIPKFDGKHECSECFECKKMMHQHGWIKTLEGGHIVCPSDWIITGIKGEYYPVKDVIFKLTYNKKQENKNKDEVIGGNYFVIYHTEEAELEIEFNILGMVALANFIGKVRKEKGLVNRVFEGEEIQIFVD